MTSQAQPPHSALAVGAVVEFFTNGWRLGRVVRAPNAAGVLVVAWPPHTPSGMNSRKATVAAGNVRLVKPAEAARAGSELVAETMVLAAACALHEAAAKTLLDPSRDWTWMRGYDQLCVERLSWWKDFADVPPLLVDLAWDSIGDCVGEQFFVWLMARCQSDIARRPAESAKIAGRALGALLMDTQALLRPDSSQELAQVMQWAAGKRRAVLPVAVRPALRVVYDFDGVDRIVLRHPADSAGHARLLWQLDHSSGQYLAAEATNV